MLQKLKTWLWFKQHKKDANAVKDKIKKQGFLTATDMADLILYEKDCRDAYLTPIEGYLNRPNELLKTLTRKASEG